MTNARIFVDEAGKLEKPLREEWQTDASCASNWPEIFFPGKGESYANARKICAQCAVLEECLEYAMQSEGSAASGDRFGMFGGLTPKERYELYKASEGLTEHDSNSQELQAL